MQILVTGAAGRIGKRLVDKLLDLGYHVRGADVRETNRNEPNFESYTGKLEDDGAAAMVKDIKVVFHLGAFMSWYPTDASEVYLTNVEGTRLLLDASASAGVDRFIFASSGEVYPENAPEFQPITEKHPLQPNSLYGLTKLLGEELVCFHQRTGSMNTVILRFAHTQDATELLNEDSFFSGPRFFLHPKICQQKKMGNSSIVDQLRACDPGEPALILACNENGRPYRMHITDVRDMVDGLILAMESKKSLGGIFNLGSAEPIDFGQLLPQMAEITGYQIVPVKFAGQGVHYHTSIELIRTELGFKPKWTMDKMLVEAEEAWRTRKQLTAKV